MNHPERGHRAGLAVRLILLVLAAAAAPAAGSDGVFSSVNRYALSFEWLDSVSAGIRSPGSLLLSSGHVTRTLERDALVAFDAGAMGRLAVGPALRGGLGISAADSVMTFASVEIRALYESKYVRGWVDLRVANADSLDGPWPRETFYERQRYAAQQPIDGGIDWGPTLVEGWLNVGTEHFNVTIGNEKFRWGPGYKGTLGWSGTGMAPMIYYHIRANIGRALRLQSFLAGFEDEQTMYRAELGQTWPADTLPNGLKSSTIPARYGAGQRIDLALGSHVQVGVYEFVDFYGSSDLTRYANPLQVYYVGSRTGNNAGNLLGGLDANVLLGPVRLYGEFINDDITVFEDVGNPNRWAWMGGVQYAGAGRLRLLGAEYAHITQYTYAHMYVINKHAVWNEPLGWPYGNYQEHANVHAVVAFRPDLRMRAELGLWYGGAGKLSDDWMTDGKPDLDHAPYWPREGETAVTALVEARWEPLRWLGLDLSLRPGWCGGTPVHQAAVFLRLSAPKSFAVRMRSGE